MTHARAPYLGLFLSALSISLAPAPIGADNIHADLALGYGFGGKSTTPQQQSLWQKLWILSRNIKYLDHSTTPQQQNRSSHVCVRVRARLCACAMLWRCGVVSYLNSLKRKKERHNSSHGKGTTGCCGWSNPLKNIKKGGFAHG